MRIIDIAAVCHEANRAYCTSLGDESQAPWRWAPQWQRESSVSGVETAIAGATPEENHVSWLAEKEEAGWVYGEKKNAHRKIHPCLVPYAELPADQKKKDDLFVAIVNALAPPVP